MVDERAVRQVDDLPDEAWDDESRGEATWRTLFSGDVTGTQGLTTGVCVVPVGGELAAHRHSAVESYFFLEGTGLQRLGDEELPVREGSALLISGRTIHATRNTGEGPLRFFSVFAADSFADVRYEFD